MKPRNGSTLLPMREVRPLSGAPGGAWRHISPSAIRKRRVSELATWRPAVADFKNSLFHLDLNGGSVGIGGAGKDHEVATRGLAFATN
jgi:hypothetical protein